MSIRITKRIYTDSTGKTIEEVYDNVEHKLIAITVTEKNELVQPTKPIVPFKPFTIFNSLMKAAGLLSVSNEQKELAKKRLKICSECPYVTAGTIANATSKTNQAVSWLLGKKSLDQELTEDIEIDLVGATCSLCGCGLIAKTISPTAYCPIKDYKPNEVPKW